MPFDSIIQSTQGQISFLKFLEPDGSDNLLRFWIDVEKLKQHSANIRRKYELANRIYENYLKKYDSPVRDEIGKDLVKSMQLFLIGNSVCQTFCEFKLKKNPNIMLESILDGRGLLQIANENKEGFRKGPLSVVYCDRLV